MTRLVEDSRDELAEALVNVNQVNERVKSIEGIVRQESDEKRRTQMEVELNQLKYMLDIHKQRDQRVREREQRLSEQLRIEQGKLDDFESRLDTLEREITTEVLRQESDDKTRIMF